MPEQNRGEVWLIDLGIVAKIRSYLVISKPVLVQDVPCHGCGTYNQRA